MQLKNDLGISETNLVNRLNERKNILEEIKDIEKSLEKIDRLKEIDISQISESISSKNKEITLMENSLREISYKVSGFEIIIKNSEKIKNDIFILKKCPVCKQDVSESHKDHIRQAEDESIKEAQENKKIYQKQEREARLVLESFKKEISELEDKKHEFQIFQLKEKNNKEKELRIFKLNSNIETIKIEIGKINSKKLEINESIKGFGDLDKHFESANEKIEELREQITKTEIQKSRLETRLSETNKQFLILNKEISSQQILKGNLNKIVNIQNWIEDNFLRLIDTIESHIMLKINTDFNELFERWFSMLIETENLNIRLDESFSPIIDQNGYEIEYENLSGGEKTAAALAYRLALNQVINTIVSVINTRDLIILDEPTDGFSEDQLDKIRLVLNELNTKQTIIVSHESKIESFVDTIIRFNKKDHISEVVI
jgi:exonuclease SbcC